MTKESKTSSNDPFPKWKWMMDYCRERKWHPTDFWDLAEKAYNETLRQHQEKNR